MKLPPKVLQAVKEWRKEGYPNVSDTTKRLLRYWFYEDHIFEGHPEFEDGMPFNFWECQREAIESIIYLYEVCEYESLYEISRGFEVNINFDPNEDNWANYCLKMATGSGKTFVMAMALVWQYFNHRFEEGTKSTDKFLIIAPNLIVLDRLMDGFAGGGVFKEFPFFVPDEWKSEFDLQILEQSSDNPVHGEGVVHVTNVQQFYDRSKEEVDNPIQNLLGEEPTQGEELSSDADLKEIIKDYDKVIVFNDEAHHAHKETQWNEVLKEIHGEKERIFLQLDFTATAWDIAREQQVHLPHIVYNYSLKRALEAEPPIIKNPIIATIEGQQNPASEKVIKQYLPQIRTAKRYLERRKEDLEDVDKKPVLFVVCQLTDQADEVAEYFKEDLGYGDKVLVIHTYLQKSKYGQKGDVKKDDIEKAREAAKNIDDNKYEVIISVGMLQEGWDVRNVSIILPMRAFGSSILVEQTLGRGLRRMFPNNPDANDNLYVIEHPRFRDLWEEKIKEQDLDIRISSEEDVYQETNKVYVMKDKEEFNIEIPIMKGGIVSTKPDLSKIELTELPQDILSLEDIEVVTPKVIEQQLKDKKKVGEWKLEFDFAPTKEEYFAFLAQGILKKAGSRSQVSKLIPILRRYIKNHFFEESIKEIDKEILKKINSFEVRNKVAEAFVKELNALGRESKDYKSVSKYDLTETKPWHTNKPVYKADKTVFNALPYPKTSSYEKDFMRYLDNRKEVESYTKIFSKIPLRISYYDEEKGVRYYIPDFIVKTRDKFYLLETKGEGYDRMTPVKQKAEAGKRWCENASEFTEEDWEYGKIVQNDFEKGRGKSMDQLIKVSE
ncbi:MAG: DEAD/DEAH box helicase [Elusimicrobiota bacterium]